MACCCGELGRSKSVLKGIEYKLPSNLSVTDYFRKCIIEGKIKPDSPAIISEDGTTVSHTYSQLDSLSTKLAKALRQYLGFWTCNNPDSDLVMAFSLPVSDDVPVVLLAILKLGAAFLSIPTVYPEQLIVKIVSVTKPILVITESVGSTKSRYDVVGGLVPLVDFEELMHMALHGGFDDVNDVFPLETLIRPSDRMASIVYTAGTMDQQLAVRIGHSEILNRCFWQYKEFPYMEGEVQALSSGVEDVESIAEIFAPLLSGFPLHLMPHSIVNDPPELLKRIQNTKISRITLPPPALASLLISYEENMCDCEENKANKDMGYLTGVKYWMVSGDTMSQDLVTRFFNVLSPDPLPQHHHHHHRSPNEVKSLNDVPTTLIHLYGSTEVVSDVTFETFENCSHLPSKFMDERVSIGRPIGNTIVYVVDEDMRLVDTGVIGEICIAGSSVASGGYVSGTEKDDANRFCTNPFTTRKGYTTIYQTEDFGRISVNKDGTARLFYEGRTEMTAKVMGKRIDLRDVSKLVQETKLVEQCFALCFHPGKLDQAIVAFCKLLQDVTQEQLEEKLATTITETHLMPQIFAVEEFHYLPTGRLDKHKLLKQYLYTTMNVSPEDWQAVQLSPLQKNAAKILFSAIAKYTHKTLRQVINCHRGTLWSLGVDSLSAISVYLHIKESGFLINIDTFLQADDLIGIVENMRTRSKNDHPAPGDQKFKLFSMPHVWYYADSLINENKDSVIQILSNGYSIKNCLCKHLSMAQGDIAKFLEAQWKLILKDSLSVVAFSYSDDEMTPLGAALILDASVNLKAPSDCPLGIKYWRELINSTDKGPKEHIVWKKTGTVSQITFLGTAESVPTEHNIMIIALLLEAAKIGAKSRGYNGTIVSCENPLVIDMCEGILNFKILEEAPIYKFRAKDKTMPFRLLSEYHTLQVMYESF